jgi:hypothetical protein
MRHLLCTLDDASLATRAAEWRSLLGAATGRFPTSEGGVRLVFPSDATVAERIEELIAKEASCCSWMIFDVERTAEALTVTVSGPEEARAGLVAAFASDPI